MKVDVNLIRIKFNIIVMNKIVKYIALSGGIWLFQSASIFAQTEADGQTVAETASWFSNYSITELSLIGIAIISLIVIVLASFTIMRATNTLIYEVRKDALAKQGIDLELIEAAKAAKPSIWEGWYDKLTDAVPVQQEEDVMMHHNYDGIRELDNNLPPWWKYMFYASMVFAVVYFTHYHILGTGLLPHEELAEAIAQGEADKAAYLAQMANLVDETNVTVLTDEGSIVQGQTIFIEKCAQCHMNDGGGSVGPNLTDKYWIHGGSIEDIFKTIKYGVPAKGMIAWESQLRPPEMQKVASFIYSLEGTTPQQPKEAEGEIYERVAETEEAAAEETSTN